MAMENNKILLVLAAIITLSISYYFVIALPSHNEAILKLERDKFQVTLDEKKKEEQEKKLKDEDAQYRQSMLEGCQTTADEAYMDYIKLNGTPVKGKIGVYSFPRYVEEDALKIKKETFDECHRKWETK